MDNVQKETHVVSVMMHSLLETVANLRGEKDDHLSPAPNSKANTHGKTKILLTNRTDKDASPVGSKEQDSMSMEKLYQSVMWSLASSSVPELQN